jgi:hypothetical protein
MNDRKFVKEKRQTKVVKQMCIIDHVENVNG